MPKVTEAHRDAKRMQILAAAEDVLIRKGYEATSMKDIVEASGKSFGGVYMYYGSKEQLFYDLLKRRYAEMNPDGMSAPQRSSWDSLALFMEDQLHRAEKAAEGLAPVMYEFFIAGRRDAKRRELLEERYEAIREAIRRLLRQGTESGEFTLADQGETLAHVMISFLDGVFIESILNGTGRIRIRDQFRLMLEMIEAELRRK